MQEVEEKTSTGFTDTADGKIPHLVVKHENMSMPVVMTKLRNNKNKCYPERTPRGFLVYALPGGGKTTLDKLGLH